MSTRCRPWQDWEIRLLRKLAKNGESAPDASDVLDNRTPVAVARKARLLGLKTGRGRAWKVDATSRARLLDCLEANPGIRLRCLALLLVRNEKTVRKMVARLVSEGFITNDGGMTNSSHFRVTKKWSVKTRESDGSLFE